MKFDEIITCCRIDQTLQRQSIKISFSGLIIIMDKKTWYGTSGMVSPPPLNCFAPSGTTWQL